MSKQRARTVVGAATLLFLFTSTSALAAQPMRAAMTRAARHKRQDRVAGLRYRRVLLGKRSVQPVSRALRAGQAEAFRLQARATGLAQVANVYLSAGNTASTVVVGLYNEANGQPGSLLGTSSAAASSAGSWTAISIPPLEIHAGAIYWLAILGTGGTLRYSDRRHGPCPSQTSAQTALAALPAGWRRGRAYSACPISAYVTTGPSSQMVAPTNTALPAIIGSTTEGQMLSASTGTWTGNPSSYGYRWEACDALGEGCLAVPGATSSSFKLAASDFGSTIRVVVTAFNTGGSTPATSEATGTVVSAAPANTALPAVSGTTEEGQTLTVSEGSWTGSPTSYTYQWQDCNATGGACTSITDATSISYKLASTDVGYTLRVVVTATSVGGSTPATSEPTGTVVTAAPTNTAPPAISGPAIEGQTLSASTGTWTGSASFSTRRWQTCDGPPEGCLGISDTRSFRFEPSTSGMTSYTYQWQECNTAGEACTSITGATASSYKLPSSDIGHRLRVAVTATDAGGSSEATSEATPAVVTAAPTNTVLPVISGVAEEGRTLTASEGSWTGAPTSYGYVWQDCNTSGEACASIAGATSSSYKLASSDVGHKLRVQVTATNTGGSTKATSEATGTVLAAPPPAPTNTALPAISGSTEEGQTLSATTGSWTGSPTSYTYQWQDCNTAGEACTSITSATSSNYKLASSDVGHKLRVQVTATNTGGSTKATSEATGTVLAAPPPAPTNTALPAISGSTEEGQTLSATTGSWTGSPTSYTYQWQDCNTAGEACTSITSATSSNYKLASSDVGHKLRVQVTATNTGGSTKTSSEATATVVEDPVSSAPEVDGAPLISGTAEEGQTLAASTGTWTGTPTSYSYQWKEFVEATEAYEPIEGATSSMYTLGPLDSSHKLEVEVGATNAAGTTWVVSDPTGSVAELATANLWVATGGGSCERFTGRHPYEASKACGKFNEAFQKAQCGDVIEIKAGQYGEGGKEGGKGPGSKAYEIIRADAGLESCTTPVTFQPGPGEEVKLNKLQAGTEAGNASAPDWAAFNNLTIYETFDAFGPAHNITVDHQRGGSDGTNGGHHILFENSEYGPCSDSYGPSEEWPCAQHGSIESGNTESKFTAEYVTFAHNLFRKFESEGHFECIFISGGHHLLIEGNHFANCSEEGIFVQEAEHKLGWIDGLTIQNNILGRIENPKHEPRSTAIEMDNIYGENLLVRYNSLGFGNEIQGPGENHSPHNTVAIGNITNASVGCDASIEQFYDLLVKEGTHQSNCGTGSELAASPPYVDSTLAMLGEPLDENFELKTGTQASKLVPDNEANDKIEWDYSGSRRSANGPWDAGAEEG